MNNFHDFVSTTLADRKIEEAEVALIRDQLYADGRLDLDDVKLLVELYCGATERCPAFDALFFSVLEEVILEDGEVQTAEQFYLLKMVYSDRVITDHERQFLRSLRDKVIRVSPEFDMLCEDALNAPSTNWSVGGS